MTDTTTADTPQAIRKALRRAFEYGKTYWQQAESEYFTDQDRSYVTHDKFTAFMEETVTALTTAPPAAKEAAPLHIFAAQNDTGETMCIVRWQIETPAGWVGAYDKAALEYLLAARCQDAEDTAEQFDVDALAQEIRRVDGSHSLGAGALADALMLFFGRVLRAQKMIAKADACDTDAARAKEGKA